MLVIRILVGKMLKISKTRIKNKKILNNYFKQSNKKQKQIFFIKILKKLKDFCFNL